MAIYKLLTVETHNGIINILTVGIQKGIIIKY